MKYRPAHDTGRTLRVALFDPKNVTNEQLEMGVGTGVRGVRVNLVTCVDGIPTEELKDNVGQYVDLINPTAK